MWQARLSEQLHFANLPRGRWELDYLGFWPVSDPRSSSMHPKYR
jgi:hypothetical protein